MDSNFAQYIMDSKKLATTKDFNEKVSYMVDGDSSMNVRPVGFDTPESNTKTDKFKEVLKRSGLTKEEYANYAKVAKIIARNSHIDGYRFGESTGEYDTYGRELVDMGTMGQKMLDMGYATTGAKYGDFKAQKTDLELLEKVARLYGKGSPKYKALMAQRERTLDMTGGNISFKEKAKNFGKSVGVGAINLAKSIGDVVLDTVKVWGDGDSHLLEDINADEIMNYKNGRNRKEFENKEALGEFKRGEYFSSLGTALTNIDNLGESLPEIGLMFSGFGSFTRLGKLEQVALRSTDREVQLHALQSLKRQASGIERINYKIAKNAGFSTAVIAHTNEQLDTRAKNGDSISITDRLGVLTLTTLSYLLEKLTIKSLAESKSLIKQLTGRLSDSTKLAIGAKLAKSLSETTLKEGSQEYIQEWADVLSEDFGIKDIYRQENLDRTTSAAIQGAGSSHGLKTVSGVVKNANDVTKMITGSDSAIEQSTSQNKEETKQTNTLSNDDELLLKIGTIESKNKADAVNPITGATGKYQFIKKYWEKDVKKELGVDWNEFSKSEELQDKFMKSKLNNYKSYLEKNNYEINDFNLYMVHQLGYGDFKKFQKGKLREEVIKNNLPENIEPTFENYKKYWQDKFGISNNENAKVQQTDREVRETLDRAVETIIDVKSNVEKDMNSFIKNEDEDSQNQLLDTVKNSLVKTKEVLNFLDEVKANKNVNSDTIDIVNSKYEDIATLYTTLYSNAKKVNLDTDEVDILNRVFHMLPDNPTPQTINTMTEEGLQGLKDILSDNEAKKKIDNIIEIKNQAKVDKDIWLGGQGYKGIVQHQHDIEKALDADNQHLVEKYTTEYSKFVAGIQKKYRDFREAYIEAEDKGERVTVDGYYHHNVKDKDKATDKDKMFIGYGKYGFEFLQKLHRQSFAVRKAYDKFYSKNFQNSEYKDREYEPLDWKKEFGTKSSNKDTKTDEELKNDESSVNKNIEIRNTSNLKPMTLYKKAEKYLELRDKKDKTDEENALYIQLTFDNKVVERSKAIEKQNSNNEDYKLINSYDSKLSMNLKNYKNFNSKDKAKKYLELKLKKDKTENDVKLFDKLGQEKNIIVLADQLHFKESKELNETNEQKSEEDIVKEISSKIFTNVDRLNEIEKEYSDSNEIMRNIKIVKHKLSMLALFNYLKGLNKLNELEQFMYDSAKLNLENGFKLTSNQLNKKLESFHHKDFVPSKIFELLKKQGNDKVKKLINEFGDETLSKMNEHSKDIEPKNDTTKVTEAEEVSKVSKDKDTIEIQQSEAIEPKKEIIEEDNKLPNGLEYRERDMDLYEVDGVNKLLTPDTDLTTVLDSIDANSVSVNHKFPKFMIDVAKIVVANYLKYSYRDLFYNDDEAISAILKKDKRKITNEDRNKFKYRGTLLKNVVNRIAQDIDILSGIKVSKGEIDGKLKDRYIGELALLMIISMVNNNIMNIDKEISVSELNQNANNPDAKIVFIQPNPKLKYSFKFDEDVLGSILPKNIRGYLDEPYKGNDVYLIENTDIKVTSIIKNFINILNNSIHRYVEDGLSLLSKDFIGEDMSVEALSQSPLGVMMGYKDPNKVHISIRESVKGKNMSIGYDIQNLILYQTDKDMYFKHVAKSNARIMINSNTINRASSKLHRFMVYNVNDKEVITENNFELFKISVIDALNGGIADKTDKNIMLNMWNDIINNDEIKELALSIVNGKPNKDLFIKYAHEEHSIIGMINLGLYFKNKEKLGFKGYLGTEADDKTSGIGLQTIFYFDNSEEANAVLPRVGIFTEDRPETSFYDFNDLDSYQVGAIALVENVNEIANKGDYFRKIRDVFSSILPKQYEVKNGKKTITGWWRQLLKDPTMQGGYGAGEKSLSENMFYSIIENFRVDLGNSNLVDRNIEVLNHFKELVSTNVKPMIDKTIKELKTYKKESDLLEVDINPIVLNQLSEHFRQVYGKAIEQSLDSTYKHINKMQKSFTELTNRVQELMISKFEEEKAKKLKELGRKSLSLSEERELFNSIDKPYLITYNGGKIPLFSFGFNEKLDTEQSVQVKHTAVKTVNKNDRNDFITTAQSTFYIRSNSVKDVGVKASAVTTQSTDSTIQAIAFKDGLNIFDAYLGKDVYEYSENKNKAIYDLIQSGFNPLVEFEKEVNEWTKRNNIDFHIDEYSESKVKLRDKNIKSIHHNIIHDTEFVVDKSEDNPTIDEEMILSSLDVYKKGTTDKEKLELRKKLNYMFNKRFENLTKKEFIDEFRDTKVSITKLKKLYKLFIENQRVFKSSFEEIEKLDNYVESELTSENIIKTYDDLNILDNRVTNDSDTHLKRVLNTLIVPTINTLKLLVGKYKKNTAGQIKGDTVTINIGSGYQSAKEAYVHELLHNLTNKMFDSKKMSVVERSIRDIMNNVRKKYDHTIFKTSKSKQIWNYVFNSEYAVREFTSYSLTNPDLIDVLSKDYTVDGKNLFYKMINLVKKLFNDFINYITIGKIPKNDMEKILYLLESYNKVQTSYRSKLVDKVYSGFTVLDNGINNVRNKVLDPKYVMNYKFVLNKMILEDKNKRLNKWLISPLLHTYIHAINWNQRYIATEEQNQDFREIYDKWSKSMWNVNLDKDGFIYQFKENILGNTLKIDRYAKILRKANLTIDGKREEIEHIIENKIRALYDDSELEIIGKMLLIDFQSLYKVFSKDDVMKIIKDKDIKYKDLYNKDTISAAKELGYYLATGKRNDNFVLQMNSSAIKALTGETNSIDNIDALISYFSYLNIADEVDKLILKDRKKFETLIAYHADYVNKNKALNYNNREYATVKGELFLNKSNARVIRYVLKNNINAHNEMSSFRAEQIKEIDNPFDKKNPIVVYAVDNKYAKFQQGTFRYEDTTKRYTLTNLHTELYGEYKRFADIDIKNLDYTKFYPLHNEKFEVYNFEFLALDRQEELEYQGLTRRADLLLGNSMTRVDVNHTVNALNREIIDKLAIEYATSTDKNGFNVVDKENDLWKRLPIYTRIYLNENFKGKFYYPKGMKDLLFGYEEFSLATKLTNPQLKEFVKTIEDIWKEFIKIWKVTVVIKMPIVLIDNIVSNFVVSMQYKLNPIDVLRWQRDGLVALQQYRKDKEEMISIIADRDAGLLYDAQRLKDLRRMVNDNEISDLIEDGMLQSIIDNPENTSFNNLKKIRKGIDKVDDKTPAVLKTVSKQLFITHDTTIFKTLFEMTQASDFVARYAMKKGLEQKGWDKDRIKETVLDAFIQYDIPDHKAVKYLDDIGILAFQKYFFRIQRILFKQLKLYPATTIMLSMLGLANPLDSLIFERGLFSKVDLDPTDNIEDVLTPQLLEAL